PHERGSNENRNRVLRRFIPKGQPIEIFLRNLRH
ncbi:IS30 family transposase, partial [Lactobacillus reuteri]|nr:IS30 family transposase [Limosilactobacillus reuteri]MQB67390.1 IS30 family transposase [Limosilactobacillus reuteri]MQB79484.1 IS30 family transposase [Limosilactobacillus reuteri]MQB81064.1 IS30 family transposase [Limosilactobacillus reuteri]MQB83096.1 IS30 family transposase [Limosilactobacillus reuteri]